MIHINLICLGKLKEQYWRDAEAEYLKRLGAFAKINIIELREESFDAKNNLTEIKTREAEKIKKELDKLPNSFVIVLNQNGKNFSSEQLAEKMTELTNQQINNLTFIIGGPLGLCESILKIADLKLSLSSLTFTHQMARVILWEQIYRASMIGAGRQYHY